MRPQYTDATSAGTVDLPASTGLPAIVPAPNILALGWHVHASAAFAFAFADYRPGRTHAWPASGWGHLPAGYHWLPADGRGGQALLIRRLDGVSVNSGLACTPAPIFTVTPPGDLVTYAYVDHDAVPYVDHDGTAYVTVVLE